MIDRNDAMVAVGWARRMSRIVPLLSAGVVLAVAGCAPSHEACRLYMLTSVPLTAVDDGTKLVVPAVLAGKPLSLVVDTGADMTTLTEKALTDSAHMTGYDHPILGVGGQRIADVAILSKLQLGDLHGDIAADVLDFDLVAGDRPRDGLLGMNLLGAYDVDIDLPGHELRFYLAQGNCAAPTAAIAPPLYTVEQTGDYSPGASLSLKVTIAGRTFNAVIDTGADGTALFANAARRLGLVGNTVAGDRVDPVSGVGRRKIDAHIHTLDEITIGDLALRHVPVAVLDQNGQGVDLLLGSDFVNRVHLWLSRSSHTIIMQVPPSPSLPPAR